MKSEALMLTQNCFIQKKYCISVQLRKTPHQRHASLITPRLTATHRMSVYFKEINTSIKTRRCQRTGLNFRIQLCNLAFFSSFSRLDYECQEDRLQAILIQPTENTGRLIYAVPYTGCYNEQCHQWAKKPQEAQRRPR